MNIEESKIESAVIEQAVETLVSHYSRNGDGDLSGEIRKQATEIIKKHIDERVQQVLVDGINGLMFPMTNSYGEKKQPDKTLREYIDSLIQWFLQEEVDSDGRTRNTSYGSRGDSRIVWIVKQEISKHVAASVKAAADAINLQISGVISAIVKAEIDKAVVKLRG